MTRPGFEHPHSVEQKNQSLSSVLLSRPQVDLASTKNSRRLTFQDYTAPELRPSGTFQSAIIYDLSVAAMILKQPETVAARKINSRKGRTISTCSTWSRRSGTNRRRTISQLLWSEHILSTRCRRFVDLMRPAFFAGPRHPNDTPQWPIKKWPGINDREKSLEVVVFSTIWSTWETSNHINTYTKFTIMFVISYRLEMFT